MPNPRSMAVLGSGLTVAVVAEPLAGWLASTSNGRWWSHVVDDMMSARPGPWHLLRGAFAYLAIPVLLTVLALLLVVAYREAPWYAWVLGGVTLLTNVTVQAIKLGPLGLDQGPSELNPTKRSRGVAAGVCLGWIVVAPAAQRRLSAVAAATTLVVATCGILLTGWHSPFQLLCPLLIGTGWAIVGAAVLPRAATAHRGRSPSGESRRGVLALLSGGVLVFVVTALLVSSYLVGLSAGTAPVVMACAWVTGWCVGATGLLMLASSYASVRLPPITTRSEEGHPHVIG